MKKWICLWVLILVFCGQRAIPDGKVQTVFEKSFEHEIEDAIFITAQIEGKQTFYPGIVELRMLDTVLSGDDKKFYNREILILDPAGSLTNRLSFPYKSTAWYADNGRYFAVMTVMPYTYDPTKLTDAKIKVSFFVVYDGSGKMLWKRSPYEYELDTTFVYIVSPKDGSILVFNTPAEMLYDPSGRFLPGPAKLKQLYDQFEFLGFSDNWKFIVGHANKLVNDEYGIAFIVPAIMYLDSNFVIQWESPLIQYAGSTVGISAQGSYVYASCPTGDTAQNAKLTSMGYVYNRYKERFMEIKNGADFRALSRNEKYLVADYTPPKAKKVKRMLIDVEVGKILYKKELGGETYLVAENGSVAALSKTELDDGSHFLVTAYDPQGNPIFKHEITASAGEESNFACKLLQWNGEILFVSVIDKLAGKISILSLTR